jgi:hypothetical protein
MRSLCALILATGLLAVTTGSAQAQTPQQYRWSATPWMERAAITLVTADLPKTEAWPLPGKIMREHLTLITPRRLPVIRYRCLGQAPPGLKSAVFGSNFTAALICGGGAISGEQSGVNYVRAAHLALADLQGTMVYYAGIGLYRHDLAKSAKLTPSLAALRWSCRGRSKFHQKWLIINKRLIKAVDCSGQYDVWPNDGPSGTIVRPLTGAVSAPAPAITGGTSAD